MEQHQIEDAIGITGLVVFVAVWGGSIMLYGFLGFALGWMPAAFLCWMIFQLA